MNMSEIEERKKQHIERLKAMLDEYVKNGGILEDLSKGHPVYEAIKNYDIRVNGKRLSLEERFAFLGYPRKPQQKPFEEKLKEIKSLLDEFVANGGDINSIDSHHELYIKIRAFTPRVNGKKLTLEEIFALAGHPRQPRYNDAQLFIRNLSRLEDFKDENGFVDSYRKDPQMKAFIAYCSEQFKLPSTLVVCFLADQKLKSHVVYTNRVEFLRTQLAKYLETHSDFCGIRRIDPQLYHLLNSVAKTYPTPNGQRLSNLEIVELLGFENVENSFSTSDNLSQFSERAFMSKYAPIIEANKGTISLSDINDSDYYNLTIYLRRLNTTKAAFFAKYNVKYLDQRIVERNKRVSLNEYPYYAEMKKMLFEVISEYCENNPDVENMSEEELFFIKLEAVKAVYAQFEDKIQQKYILDSQVINQEEQPN